MKIDARGVSNRSFNSMCVYMAIAFIMAWSFWFVAWLIADHKLSLPLFPIMVIGSFGPLVGAIGATWREGGPRIALGFLGRALDLRMGWPVFLVSLFLLPLIAVIIEFAHAAVIHVPPQFTMTLSQAPLNYLFLFVLGGTLAEEYGWSFLSDKLDDVLPIVPSTFVLGVIWALWHLPLFFIVTPGAIQGYTPFYIFMLATVAMRFLFAWAYHRSNRNILSNMLFHTAANMAYSIVPLAPSPDDMSTSRLWMFAIFNILIAVALWGIAPIRTKSASMRGSAQSVI